MENRSRVAVYLLEGPDLWEQKWQCYQFALWRKLDVYAVYTDEADSQVAFKTMLRDYAADQFDAVLIQRLDRLGRDPAFVFAIEHIIRIYPALEPQPLPAEHDDPNPSIFMKTVHQHRRRLANLMNSEV